MKKTKIHMLYVRPGKKASRLLCNWRKVDLTGKLTTPKREAVDCDSCIRILSL